MNTPMGLNESDVRDPFLGEMGLPVRSETGSDPGVGASCGITGETTATAAHQGARFSALSSASDPSGTDKMNRGVRQ